MPDNQPAQVSVTSLSMKEPTEMVAKDYGTLLMLQFGNRDSVVFLNIDLTDEREINTLLDFGRSFSAAVNKVAETAKEALEARNG